MNVINDYFLWIAIVARVAVYFIFKGELLSGYHMKPQSFLPTEELYIIYSAMTEAIPIFWFSTELSHALVQLSLIPPRLNLFIVTISVFSVIFGIIETVRWFIVWSKSTRHLGVHETLSTDIRLVGLFITILFGTYCGAAIYTALNPNAPMVKYVFNEYLGFVLAQIQQFKAILGIQVGIVLQYTGLMESIFVNNASLALLGGIFGLAGGLLIGLGVPLLLVMAANASITGGVFTGILIRNSLIAGNVFAPILAPFATLGILHGFLEYSGIVIVGIGGGFIGVGFSKTRGKTIKNGAIIAITGFAVVGLAAFVEVFVDSPIVHFIKGNIAVKASILPLQLNNHYFIGGAVTLISLGVIVPFLIAFGTRYLIGGIERIE